MNISIIVPAYNEEQTIAEILDKLKNLRLEYPKEIIVVDDGSSDKTSHIVKRKGVKLIRHNRNRGKGAAIRTGIKNSHGDVIIIQDADLEYDPKDIPSMLKEIKRREQAVYGSRFLGKIEKMSPANKLGNKIITLTTRLLFGQSITDTETGYKVFRRSVLNKISLESNGFEIEPEITAKIMRTGYKIQEVPINYVARKKIEKKITWKDGVKAIFTLLKYKIKS